MVWYKLVWFLAMHFPILQCILYYFWNILNATPKFSLETNAKYLQNILSLTKKPKYQKKINNLFCLTLILYKFLSKLVSQTVPRDTYQIHWTQMILLHINVWVAYMHHEMVGPSTRLAELTNEWCTFSIRIIHIIIKSWTLMYCRKK